ncbi:8620_t:CDS:2, partial [Dentiscutata erythropus]
DRVYAKSANVPLVYELGLELFRDTIVRSTIYLIQNHLLDILLNQILLERENEIIDRRFLETSAEYYQVEGQMLVGECDAPEYMKKIEKRLNEEE